MARDDAGTWMPDDEEPKPWNHEDEEDGDDDPHDLVERVEDLEDEVKRIDVRVDDLHSDLSGMAKDVHEIKSKLSWATVAVCACQVALHLIDWAKAHP